MLGMLAASVISGRLVTRWGRYRIFPILGTALMTLGAYLLSLIDASTNGWVLAFYMFVFGVGMGLIMQVLVVAVQNAVSYQDLGVATSAATFFRMIGGSFGTAVFGAIYAITFNHTFAPTLARVPAALLKNFNPQTLDPALLAKLKSTAAGLAFFTKYIDAVTHSVQTVFLVAVPISFVAFLLSFLLPEVPLRKTVETVDVGEVSAHRSTGRRSRRSSWRSTECLLGRTGPSCTPRWPSGPGSTCRRGRSGCSTDWPTGPACTVNEVADRFKSRHRADPARGRRVWCPPAWSRQRHRGADHDVYLTAQGHAGARKA